MILSTASQTLVPVSRLDPNAVCSSVPALTEAGVSPPLCSSGKLAGECPLGCSSDANAPSSHWPSSCSAPYGAIEVRDRQ